jgi:hypothetical protein
MWEILERGDGGIECTGLHLGDELFVEEAAGLFVERTIDGHNITLRQHLLQSLNPATSNLLLNLRLQGLVIEVQQLLAIERLQSPQDALANPSHGDGPHDLALEIKLVLGRGRDVPFASLDLLVGGNEVAHEDEDGHDDVLRDGDDVGAGYFGDGDAAVGLVGCVEVDVVGADAGGDGDLELLRLCEALRGQITWVETNPVRLRGLGRRGGVRSSDDDFRIYELLVEFRVLALLIGGCDEGMSLVLEPFADTELVLCCA